MMLPNKTILCVTAIVASGFLACSEPTSLDAPDVEGVQLRSSSAPDLASIPPFPFWARTPPICCFDNYAVVYFYVDDPAVIPADFNLLTFFDFRALGVTDWAVDGFGVFDGPTPRKTNLSGKGAVPFWFITDAQLTAAAADNYIDMEELESLNPIKGFATRFQEELHPTGSSARQVKLSTTAGGDLVGGGTFRFSLQIHDNLNTGVIKRNVKGALTMN